MIYRKIQGSESYAYDGKNVINRITKIKLKELNNKVTLVCDDGMTKSIDLKDITVIY